MNTIQPTGRQHTHKYAFVCVAVIAGALLCAFFVPGLRAFAAMRSGPVQIAAQTCAGSPSALFCDNQDPIQQGCVTHTPATRTVASRPILYQGRVVGRVDLRYNTHCRSYWGRAFAYIPGNVHIGILAPIDSWYTAETHSAYSNMVFDRRPEISGTIDVSASAVAAAAIL